MESMTGAITESIDVAQVVLYAFWIFFFGLIFWLRREDRREGYPTESDKLRRVGAVSPALIPPPKIFLLPHDEGTATAPRFDRDARELRASASSGASGAPLVPIGDPLLSGVGPATFAERADVVDKTREGHDLIVPMRVASEFSMLAGPDPRGYAVVGADGETAGTISDMWVDRADVMVRYLEITLTGGLERRLVPIGVALVRRDRRSVEISALRAAQLAAVPATREPARITRLEEEKIAAFYAGGRLYADPRRAEPKL